MRIELLDPEATLLEEIADRRLKQRDVASTYALAMQSPDVNWAKVNHAIMDRWSLSGLKRVKEMAWRIRTTPPDHA